MSTLDNLNNVTLPQRIVWECVFAYDHHHRNSHDDFSHTTRERRVWHVAAPDYALAKAAWLFKWPAHVGYELVTCTPICVLDDELRV